MTPPSFSYFLVYVGNLIMKSKQFENWTNEDFLRAAAAGKFNGMVYWFRNSLSTEYLTKLIPFDVYESFKGRRKDFLFGRILSIAVLILVALGFSVLTMKSTRSHWTWLFSGAFAFYVWAVILIANTRIRFAAFCGDTVDFPKYKKKAERESSFCSSEMNSLFCYNWEIQFIRMCRSVFDNFEFHLGEDLEDKDAFLRHVMAEIQEVAMIALVCDSACPKGDTGGIGELVGVDLQGKLTAAGAFAFGVPKKLSDIIKAVEKPEGLSVATSNLGDKIRAFLEECSLRNASQG
jgi:hypothetical protein